MYASEQQQSSQPRDMLNKQIQKRVTEYQIITKSILFVCALFMIACQPVGYMSANLDSLGEPRAALSGQLNGLVKKSLGPNGVAFNHVNPNGIVLNGATLNGATLNGATLNGATLNGATLQSSTLHGATLNGATLNGATLQSATLNGATLNGTILNSATLNGATLNGATLNGTRLSTMRIAGTPVDETTEADAIAILQHLTECALPSETCIIIYDLDERPVLHCGVEGHDPTWNTDVPDLTKSDEMGECFVRRATAAGHEASHEPWNVEAIKLLLKYMVECALSPGQSATVYDVDGVTPLIFDGALGLAPGWRDRTPTPIERKKISACLAARSNAKGLTVRISLRSPDITTTAVERTHFDTHEGAFWGDVFGANPTIYTCTESGGGVSGRTCTEGDCGFQSMGACADVCASRNATDHYYSDCAGESIVMNSFLDLGQELQFGQPSSCRVGTDDTTDCREPSDVGQLGRTSQFEPGLLQVATLNTDTAAPIDRQNYTYVGTFSPKDATTRHFGASDCSLVLRQASHVRNPRRRRSLLLGRSYNRLAR